MSGLRIIVVDGETLAAYPVKDMLEIADEIQQRLNGSVALPPVSRTSPAAPPPPPAADGAAARRAVAPQPIRRPKNTSAPCPNEASPNGPRELVLATLRKLGKADVRSIVDQIEGDGAALVSDDPERAVSAALFYQRSKGIVEHVPGERGLWRLVA